MVNPKYPVSIKLILSSKKDKLAGIISFNFAKML
jgi:hypothetical protein